jgi:hypothetical protein
VRKISFSLLTFSALLLLTGVVGRWGTSTTQAGLEAPAWAHSIDPSQITKDAHDLPSEVFVDYTFMFN